MPFKKKDKNINRAGRPKRPEQTIVSSGDINDDMRAALLRVINHPKTPGTAKVSAIREILNREIGTPAKAQPNVDSISDTTTRRLLEVAERRRQSKDYLCPHCGKYSRLDGNGFAAPPERVVEQPAEPAPEQEHERGKSLLEEQEEERRIEEIHKNTTTLRVSSD